MEVSRKNLAMNFPLQNMPLNKKYIAKNTCYDTYCMYEVLFPKNISFFQINIVEILKEDNLLAMLKERE